MYESLNLKLITYKDLHHVTLKPNTLDQLQELEYIPRKKNIHAIGGKLQVNCMIALCYTILLWLLALPFAYVFRVCFHLAFMSKILSTFQIKKCT